MYSRTDFVQSHSASFGFASHSKLATSDINHIGINMINVQVYINHADILTVLIKKSYLWMWFQYT